MEKASKIKIAKCLGWGALIIVLLFTLVLLIASPVARHLVNTKGMDWVGRELHVESVLINPFSGGVTLKGFSCKEQDGETDFIAFDQLHVRVAYPLLLAKDVKIRTIRLDGFDGQVLKYDSCLNFSDIVNRFTEPADTTEKDSTASGWKVGIGDIRISNSTVRYHDIEKNKQWQIEDISLNIPGLYFDNKKTKAGLEFGLASGGQVGVKAGYRMKSGLYDVELALQDVHTDVLMPLLEDYLKDKEIAAIVNGNLQVAGDLANIQDIRYGGDLTLSDVQFVDKSGTHEWRYNLKSVQVSGSNLTTDGITRLSLKAVTETGGTLSGSLTGDLDLAKRDTKISMQMRGINIAEFDALCRNYTGYPIEQGTLLLDSKIDVISGQMKGNNRIEIDHPRIGKKERGTKAPYRNVPVRMGFMTLTSSKDMILLDVPVTGDANNPKFSFRKVVSRALLKVFFGPLMGLKDRDKSITEEELREMEELLGEDSELFGQDSVHEVSANIAPPANGSVVLPEISE